MLKKRLIFTLYYHDGSFMLSRNFRLQKVGDITWLQRNYDFSKVAFSIDELIVLDVSRNQRDSARFCDQISTLSQGCFVPIAAGGGVRDLKDAKTLLRAGADKVVVNTPLFNQPTLIQELSSEFGQQCIVASIDAKYDSKTGYQAWTENGTRPVPGSLTEWIETISSYSIGDILLNSIDRDGTGQGFDMALLEQLPKSIPMPLIMSGGAGHGGHLAQGLSESRINAVSTGHLFNFIGDGLERARRELIDKGHQLPIWDHRDVRSLEGIWA